MSMLFHLVVLQTCASFWQGTPLGLRILLSAHAVLSDLVWGLPCVEDWCLISCQDWRFNMRAAFESQRKPARHVLQLPVEPVSCSTSHHPRQSHTGFLWLVVASHWRHMFESTYSKRFIWLCVCACMTTAQPLWRDRNNKAVLQMCSQAFSNANKLLKKHKKNKQQQKTTCCFQCILTNCVVLFDNHTAMYIYIYIYVLIYVCSTQTDQHTLHKNQC